MYVIYDIVLLHITLYILFYFHDQSNLINNFSIKMVKEEILPVTSSKSGFSSDSVPESLSSSNC